MSVAKFTPVVGERVYVRELDVFGRVKSVALSDDSYAVQCECPMPTYLWTGSSRWLEPAQS